MTIALVALCYKISEWTDFRVRVRTEIRYRTVVLLLVYDKRERAHDWKSHDMMS